MNLTIELENDETIDDIDALALTDAIVRLQNTYLDIDDIEELGMYLFFYAQLVRNVRKK